MTRINNYFFAMTISSDIVDNNRFSSLQRLVSWAGLRYPSPTQSGKMKDSKKGNMDIEADNTASRTDSRVRKPSNTGQKT